MSVAAVAGVTACPLIEAHTRARVEVMRRAATLVTLVSLLRAGGLTEIKAGNVVALRHSADHQFRCA
jgi:hypothetical protein